MIMRVSEWIGAIEGGLLSRELRRIHGHRAGERAELYLRALRLYLESFGDDEVVVSRAPGRVNVMGRHVDYMGGYVNPMATSYEIVAVVGRRGDDWVVLRNVDPRYGPKRFRIWDVMPGRKLRSLREWDEWTARVHRERLARGEGYDWDDYVKGLVIYLQDYYRDEGGRPTKRIPGFNAVVGGDVPPKRGMSSSSALVVAVALAVRRFAGIGMPLAEFIDRIGYSEWYRLTRGGSADHAAIILSRRGFVSHLSCLPTRVEEVEYAPLPEGYVVAVIDSGFERPHTEEATNYLRVTAAEYRLALLVIKSLFPQYRDRLGLLRDVNARNLGVGLDAIYEILKAVPERATRRELRSLVADEYLDELEAIFANHREPPEGYKLRQRALYGLAETERARVFPEFLRRGDVEGVLRLIRTSHDGDRVAKFDADGRRLEWDPSRFSSDESLERYIRVLRDPRASPAEREAVQLHWIPGGYERSIEPIDFMCDMIEHRLGAYAAAQIMGAGLGGNVLVLVRADKVGELESVLAETYYARYGVKPTVTVVESGEGACLLRPPLELAGGPEHPQRDADQPRREA